jgi:hypothetical protein
METIHVARAGATLGAFSLEEVREGLRTGKFLTTDLGWQAGMADWRPLSEIAGPLAAASTPQPATPQPAALPITPAATFADPVAQIGLPWERRRELGFFKAFIDTVVLVITKPMDAFAMMKPEGGMGDPLFFALIGGSFGMIVSMFFQFLLQALGVLGGVQSGAEGASGMACALVMTIIVIPIAVVLGVFIGSGLVHLCLMMLGGAKRPFETTFRVVCFSTGTTYLFGVIPFLGSYISFAYNVVLEIIGIMRAHPTDGGRAAGAVLLPVVVCCGGGFLLAFLTVGIGAFSLLGR